jgi:hypothetical protein
LVSSTFGFSFRTAIVTDFEHQQIAPCVHHGSISTAANFNDTIHSVYDSFIDILLYSYVLSLFWNAVCCHLIFFVSCAKGMRRHYEQTVSFSDFSRVKDSQEGLLGPILLLVWPARSVQPSSDLIDSDGSTKVQATEILKQLNTELPGAKPSRLQHLCTATILLASLEMRRKLSL